MVGHYFALHIILSLLLQQHNYLLFNQSQSFVLPGLFVSEFDFCMDNSEGVFRNADDAYSTGTSDPFIYCCRGIPSCFLFAFVILIHVYCFFYYLFCLMCVRLSCPLTYFFRFLLNSSPGIPWLLRLKKDFKFWILTDSFNHQFHGLWVRKGTKTERFHQQCVLKCNLYLLLTTFLL